jgi:hypothetical protein
MVLGYCVVCKASRELRDVKQIQRSGLPAIEGTCTACGTKTFVLGVDAPVHHDEETVEDA